MRPRLVPNLGPHQTPAEAVEAATTHVIQAQRRLIERLTAENAELRAKLAVLR